MTGLATNDIRARSSAVEHYLDTVGVTGSIPVAPTIFQQASSLLARTRCALHFTAVCSGGSFSDPWGITVAADGRILVADRSAFGGPGGVIACDPLTGAQTTVEMSSCLAMKARDTTT